MKAECWIVELSLNEHLYYFCMKEDDSGAGVAVDNDGYVILFETEHLLQQYYRESYTVNSSDKFCANLTKFMNWCNEDDLEIDLDNILNVWSIIGEFLIANEKANQVVYNEMKKRGYEELMSRFSVDPKLFTQTYSDMESMDDLLKVKKMLSFMASIFLKHTRK